MSNINVQPEFKKFKINQIRPSRYNPRVITPEALEGLARSISKFGCVEPIIVNIRDGANRIVGGHQRFKVLKAAKIEEIVCVIVNLCDSDEQLLNLSLNNPHLQGKFIEQLTEHIDQLREQIADDTDFINLRINILKDQFDLPEKTGL